MLEMNLSLGEFVTSMANLLGVDVMDGGIPCTFWAEALGVFGVHCSSCMSNGDAIRVQNGIRDVYVDYCL